MKLLVLDVDGVLTDGGIQLTAEGDEIKTFNVKDGSGVKYWMRAGGQVAIITGRQSPVVRRRAEELGIEVVRQNAPEKYPVFLDVLEHFGVQPHETAVIGDDLADLPLLLEAGFAAAPADAVEEVRQNAHYVCWAAGGKGCVREVVEFLLKGAGKWADILQRYRPEEQQLD